MWRRKDHKDFEVFYARRAAEDAESWAGCFFDRIDRIIRIRGRGMFSILSILLILSKKTLRPLRLCVRKTAALESGLCYNMPRLPDG